MLEKWQNHKDNISVSESGLVMYKGSRFVVAKALRAGLLKALHMGHPGVLSKVLWAKESFWSPGLKDDINHVRAMCQICHQKAPR